MGDLHADDHDQDVRRAEALAEPLLEVLVLTHRGFIRHAEVLPVEASLVVEPVNQGVVVGVVLPTVRDEHAIGAKRGH